jgi:hypothetical protein
MLQCVNTVSLRFGFVFLVFPFSKVTTELAYDFLKVATKSSSMVTSLWPWWLVLDCWAKCLCDVSTLIAFVRESEMCLAELLQVLSCRRDFDRLANLLR